LDKNVFMKKRVVFMGTPDFAVPSLQALLSSGYNVVAVYTQPDKEAGRGRHVNTTPVKELALAKGLEVVQPETLKDREVVEHLTQLKPDIIIVAAYGRIITSEILALPEFGCLNVHPSLLPRYRGSSPVVSAILQGDEVTGVTIMMMDKGLDTGPILTQRMAPIMVEDTAGSLTTRLAEIGAQLLLETIPQWLDGKIKPQPQSETGASYTRIITKEDGKVDWTLTALELWRRIRAYDPWPGCYAIWEGKRLRIIEAVALPGGRYEEAGKVVVLPKGSGEVAVGVQARDGILGLARVQLEGKKAMSAEEFLRGQRGFEESQLL
jgi:methionyl-tRNA formyltransferase